MKDYVVYHKCEKMGYPVLDVDLLRAYTKKSTIGILGSRIWLIGGESTPRIYRLRATYVISEVAPSDNPNFNSKITGKSGYLFDPMPALKKEPWFKDFLRSQSNFSFGFQPIAEATYRNGLRSVAKACGAVI